ncbi:MAG: tetratricopeptide repeat protein [Rubellimicrobium sp.]|nr:tetratricopeptide repeat protein [Rubellimicrobium sp.]
MLWSFVYILALILGVTALTFGAIMLSDLSGGAVISAGGIEVSLTPLELVVGLAALVLAAIIAIRVLGLLGAVLRFLLGDETALSRRFIRNRQRKGLEALTDATLALAAGEGKIALARAERANRLLDRPDLTRVVLAQAAEMAGDDARAESMYRRMADDGRTRFAALHGLMRRRLAAGDSAVALALARKAHEARPANAEVQDTLLRLQAESADWAGARATLAAKLRTGTLPRDVWRRREAVLALSQAAASAGTDGPGTGTGAAAIAANRLSPGLVPAAVLASVELVRAGNARQAARILRKAWEAGPHPDLAAAYAAIAPHEGPAERLRRFDPLLRTRPDHPETRMLLAELQIAAEDFPAARRALGTLPQDDPTVRALTLMAAIDRGSGADENAVRGWLTRALTAPRGPQWLCDDCGQVHAHWQPLCSQCHRLDTMSWRVPPVSGAAMPAGTELLPLVVSSPRERAGTATGPVAPDLPPDVPPLNGADT